MNCKICQHKFNDTLHTPNVLNCGHVYCLNCLIDLTDQSKCPKCNKLITSKSLIFLDYEDNESNLNTNNNNNNNNDKYSNIDSITKYLNDYQLARDDFYSMHKSKLSENKKKVEQIKTEINKRTNELINVLLFNQEKLFKEIEKINQNLTKQFNDFISKEQNLNKKFEKLNLKLNHNNHLNESELKTDLKEIIYEINNNLINCLLQLNNKYEFKCNLDLHVNVKDNLIGHILWY